VLVELAFTAGERRDSRGRASSDPALHLAARYAAKEAFVKAWSSARWGTPPALSEVALREVEVVTDRWGRPTIRLHGAVAQAVADLGPLGVHLSLSHDGPFAAAVVVIEGLAAGGQA
jgi:holo-[acyl-carrier protein] synthase